MVEKINREGYSVNGYTFRGFNTLSLKEKEMVLRWRNTENIRKWMYNKEEISLESHLKFIDNLSQREDRYYWLVTDNHDNPVGTINVTDIDRKSDMAELGLYMNPESETIGFFFVRECYNFFFNVLKIGHLYCSVAPNNYNARMIDEFLGCKFTEEKYIEDGNNKELYLVSDNLTKKDFQSKYSQSFKDYVVFIRQNQKTKD